MAVTGSSYNVTSKMPAISTGNNIPIDVSKVDKNTWMDVLGYAAPGFGQAFANRQASRDAEAGQVAAGEEAKRLMGENLDYIKGMNEPLIAMGDRQLEALRNGVENGAFDMNDDIFQTYQQYVVPQYQQGGKFQYEDRSKLVTPERFQYAQANPEQFRYEQQAPAPFSYTQQGQQQPPQKMVPIDVGGGKVMPQSTSDQQRYAQQQQYMQQSAFNEQQPNVPQYQQFRNTQQSPGQMQQPQQLQRQDFQYNQQAPQFQPVQNFGQQPQQYRAADAPQAQYVQPQQQFQGQQFRLENDPVYQRRLADSNRAIEASAAAKGMQLSGANLKELQQNAGELAAQEGDAAFNRFQQQDQTAYNRFQDQRADLKDTTRYQTEDEYRRYLDSQNIRGQEAERAIAQWNQDRQFNQAANVQNFQVGNDAYQQNFRNAMDVANMNDQNRLAYGQQNFNQGMDVQRQNFNQYAQNRGMDLNEYNANTGAQLDYANMGLGQYNTNRNFAQGVQGQNFDQYMQGRQQAQSENQQNYGQFADQRDFDANRYDQNFQNVLDVYGINNANYTGDRAFDYGVNQDYENQRRGNYEFDVNLGLGLNTQNYQHRQDAYNRQKEQKTNKYGMIGDLANIGMTARQGNIDATTGYYGSLADIGLQQANAKAAGAADRASKNTLLGQIGL